MGAPNKCGKDSRGGDTQKGSCVSFTRAQPDCLSPSRLTACPAWLDSHVHQTTCMRTVEGSRAASSPTGP